MLSVMLACHQGTRTSEHSGQSTSTHAIQHQDSHLAVVAPIAGQYFEPSERIVVAARVDPPATLRSVEFFSNGTPIGTVSAAPFRLEYEPGTVGPYAITARAQLQSGGTITAAPVQIVVRQRDESTAEISDTDVFLFGVNTAVTLLQPSPNSTFTAPVDVRLVAEAATRNGQIQRVEFLRDGRTIATRHERPYEYLWRNAPVGRHHLLARAVDTQGNIAESSPIEIDINN